jgi:protease-4
MSLEIDTMIERRRLKRRLRYWRFGFFATLVFVVFIVFFLSNLSDKEGQFLTKAHIANVKIEGMIIDSEDYANQIKELADNDSVKAVIIDINSPGGTTLDSELLYDAIRVVAAKKPVVSHIKTLAASGGYIVAVAGDYVFAYGNSITGSIGVIFQAPDYSNLLDTIGVKVDTIKSSPAKGEPTGYSPMSDEAKENFELMVADSYDWFKKLVQERRGLNDTEIKSLADGRIFTGRQAVKVGLVDSLGDSNTIRKWLKKNHNIDLDLEVVDVEPKPEDLGFFGGIEGNINGFLQKIGVKSLNSVDGLVAVWQF